MTIKKLPKSIKYAIGFGILLAIILAVMPISIDKTYPALEIKLGDPSHVVERTIVVSGTYSPLSIFGVYSPFYGSDRFDGSLQVSGYPITDLKPITAFIDNGEGSLLYKEKNSKEFNFLGTIRTQKWMRNFVLLVYCDQVPAEIEKGGELQSSWSGNGYCIVPNASSRQDAVDQVARHFKGVDIKAIDAEDIAKAQKQGASIQ